MDLPRPSRSNFNILHQLKGFCYAATTGSITKAAERMLLTQPSVSLQIQALERELRIDSFRASRANQTYSRRKIAARIGVAADRAYRRAT